MVNGCAYQYRNPKYSVYRPGDWACLLFQKYLYLDFSIINVGMDHCTHPCVGLSNNSISYWLWFTKVWPVSAKRLLFILGQVRLKARLPDLSIEIMINAINGYGRLIYL